MPDTGAPWNIPYVAGTDLVADWPTDNQSQAEAVADALDAVLPYDSLTTVTATDATWAIPTLANPMIRVTVVGGGGGGGGSSAPSTTGTSGTAGSASSVSDGTTTVTANGGAAGVGGGQNSNAPDTPDGWTAGNGGVGATSGVGTASTGGSGIGGQVKVAHFDTTGLSTLNIVIGAGGTSTGGWYYGGDGGDGVVLVEYRAG